MECEQLQENIPSDIVPQSNNDRLNNGTEKLKTMEFSESVDIQEPQLEEKRRWSIDDFERIAYISKGQFGMVWRMREIRSGRIVAVKQISKAEVVRQNMLVNLRREIEIQSHLRHKHLIECYGYFTTDTKVFLVMELAQNGSLLQLLMKYSVASPLQEPQIAKIIYQLASALNYLHERKVLHRDIKLENILIDLNGDVKLGDFGCSVIDFEDESRATFCGTVDYICPEILHKKRQGKEADVWALGVVFYELLYNTPPFQGQNKTEKMNNIYSTNWRFLDSRRQISDEAKDLLRELLNPDVEKRLNPKDIRTTQFMEVFYQPSTSIF